MSRMILDKRIGAELLSKAMMLSAKKSWKLNPPQDKPAQARAALTKTVRKARIISNKVVMTTTGAHYERWKQASAKE